MDPHETEAHSQITTAPALSSWRSSCTQVTTASKIIAAVFMIALPFIGGYVGYEIGLDTVGEVQLVQSTTDQTSSKNQTGVNLDVPGMYRMAIHVCEECSPDSAGVHYDIPVIEKISTMQSVHLSTTTPFISLSDSLIHLFKEELARGEIRFKGKGWYYDQPSVYVFDGVNVLYRPYDDDGNIKTNQIISSVVTEANVVGQSVLFVNDTFYVDGNAIEKTSMLQGISHGDMLFVTDRSMYQLDGTVKLFDNVDGMNVKLHPMFAGDAIERRGLTPVTEGAYSYFTDDRYFYCPSSENPIALPEPINVEFVKAESEPSAAEMEVSGRLFVDAQSNYYVLEFTAADGRRYTASCEEKVTD